MLSDEQLVDRLRSELAPLRPRVELAEQVRSRARASAPARTRTRSRGKAARFRPTAGTLGLAAGVLVILAAGAVVLVLAGHGAPRTAASEPAGQSHAGHTATSAVASARPGAGEVTCRGLVCHQAGHLVQNPSGLTCGHLSTWVAQTTTPETTYGCRRQPVSGY